MFAMSCKTVFTNRRRDNWRKQKGRVPVKAVVSSARFAITVDTRRGVYVV